MEWASCHSRTPSDVPLREYYAVKAERSGATQIGSSGQAPPMQQQGQQQQHGPVPPPRHGSNLSPLLDQALPLKAGSRGPTSNEQEYPAHHKNGAPPALPDQHSTMQAVDGACAAIPAFRPPSLPEHLHMQFGPAVSDDESNSPGKAQLQAVRALARRQQQQQGRQEQQPPLQPRRELPHATPPQPPQGTPGLSEATSTLRAINEAIFASINDVLMPTPGVEAGSGDSSSIQHPQREQQQREQQQREQQQREQQRTTRVASAAAGTAAAPPSQEPASRGSKRQPRPHGSEHRSGSGSRRGKLRSPAKARAASASPLREVPAPPPPPAAPQTAVGDSVALEAQSFKSPVFMSRRRRSMLCELDEPGRAIAFPKAQRRTSKVHRFMARMFGCFVPAPDERSPVPSMHCTPGGRLTPSLQGASPPPGPKLAFGMDPLRQSLAELALSDPQLRGQLCATLAAGVGSRPGSAGLAGSGGGAAAVLPAGISPLFADLLGLQHARDEEEQANMASPVLPSRPVSGGNTPVGLALGEDWDDDEDWEEEGGEESPSHAKRNLMDVLRSREAGAVQHHHQQQQQQRQQRQHAQSQQQLGRRPPSAHHLQPWQRERQAAQAAAAMPPVAAHAKATHVTLEQLLTAPSSGAARKMRSQAVLRPRQPRTDEAAAAGKQPSNIIKKRGREALGVSRAPSDDAPAFTPKRRDLSKPAYRSEALHKLLSPMLSPLVAPQAMAAAAALAGSGAGIFAGASRQAGMGTRAVAKAEGGAAAAAAPAVRPGSGQLLRRSSSTPASPLQGAAPAQARGGSAPTSPLTGTRLTRAAAMRAASTQHKLQEQEAQQQAVMAKSPDRWLRQAAAEGLSLRAAAGSAFVSPGKSARPHYHPAQVPGGRVGSQRGTAAAAGAAAGCTPGRSRFDPFAAGEAGVEPYSARLGTAEKPHLRPGLGRAAAAAGPAQAAQPVKDPHGGSEVDYARLAADGDAYMEMLQRLAKGLAVEPTQIASYKRPTPAPLPADLLGGAVTSRAAHPLVQRQAAEGVGLRRRPSQDVPGSNLASSTAEYNMAQGPSRGATVDLPENLHGEPQRVPLTPHHNALYGKDTTPTKSSPLAQQRMVSMSAAAMAAEQQVEQQQVQQQVGQQPPRQHHNHREGSSSRQASSAHAASSASASISFGSGGCMNSTRAVVCEVSGGAGQRQGGPAKGGERLARLAALLEEQQARGEHCTLEMLQAWGFSTNDLLSLKQWLNRQ